MRKDATFVKLKALKWKAEYFISGVINFHTAMKEGRRFNPTSEISKILV
jgi:hypothetical protein